MFGTNHSKLKSNLKLAIQRLKLLQKKKSENARKYTKEIADFIQINKYDRARIKVEHIIREDYMVEGMEIVEMYCDLLLARFGLVESMKELDMGLYECVSSIIWVSPRLESECVELKIIANELEKKYGKEFAQMCRSNKCDKVNERLMLKMSEQAPGDLLVEKYLVEIAKSHNVPYKTNPEIAIRDPDFFYSALESENKNDKNNGPGNGGGGFSQPQAAAAAKPLYPTNQQVSHIGFHQTVSPQNINNGFNEKKVVPQGFQDELNLPSVPNSTPDLRSNFNPNNDNQEYDDLTARFDRLKKK